MSEFATLRPGMRLADGWDMRRCFGFAIACPFLLVGCRAATHDESTVDAPIAGVDASSDAASSQPFRISLPVSPFVEIMVGAGLEFNDGTTVAVTREALAAQLVHHGATEVFARLSTEVVEVNRGGAHAMVSALARAQIASLLGLPFNVELGLFGSYGDVSCQT